MCVLKEKGEDPFGLPHKQQNEGKNDEIGKGAHPIKGIFDGVLSLVCGGACLLDESRAVLDGNVDIGFRCL